MQKIQAYARIVYWQKQTPICKQISITSCGFEAIAHLITLKMIINELSCSCFLDVLQLKCVQCMTTCLR